MLGTVTNLLEGLGIRRREAAPTPVEEDVEWYLERRGAVGELYERILETAPRRAAREIAAAIGDGPSGIYFLGSGDMMTPQMECCLHEWIVDGKSLVQKYAEEQAPPEGTEERDVLDALLRARYTVLSVEERVPGVGVRALDMLTREKLFLMDVSLSLCPGGERAALAGRIMPIGEYWMTTAGALPVRKRDARRALRKFEGTRPAGAEEKGRLFERPENVLAFVRTVMAESAGVVVDYVDAGELFHRSAEEALLCDIEEIVLSLAAEVVEGPARFAVHPPARNGPCPCGSGRKYKRCCGKERGGRRRGRRPA